MSWVPAVIFFILIVGLMIFTIYLRRQKVFSFVWSKFGEVENLKVKWTMAGPIAPGNNNSKFYVTFIDKNGKSQHFFAISSLFGDVFLREGKETPFDQ